MCWYSNFCPLVRSRRRDTTSSGWKWHSSNRGLNGSPTCTTFLLKKHKFVLFPSVRLINDEVHLHTSPLSAGGRRRLTFLRFRGYLPAIQICARFVPENC